MTANALVLIDALFVNPLVDTKRAEGVLKVSPPTARATIKTLESHEILQEITGRSWGKIYEAEEIAVLIRGE